MENLDKNPCNEEADSSELCVAHVISSDFNKWNIPALQLHAFCHLPTHRITLGLSYTGMSEELFPFSNVNACHCGYEPLISPTGRSWGSLCLWWKAMEVQMHIVHHLHNGPQFLILLELNGSCVFRRLQKCNQKDWDLEWSFYAFDVQSKAVWTHLGLLMTGAGLILEWSKHSKSVTFGRKLMIPS